MKVIVAGSRSINNYELVKTAILESGFVITELVCGEARGVDSLGKRWAQENNIPVKSFPADWVKYKKAAGHIRNKEMAAYAQKLILIWDGVSSGSKGMRKYAEEKGLTIFEVVSGN